MIEFLACVSLLWAAICPDQGSEPVAAAWESGPVMGCAYAPQQPAWYG